MWRDFREGCIQESQNAIAIRNTLTEYLLTPQGEVPWQYDYVRRHRKRTESKLMIVETSYNYVTFQPATESSYE